MNDAWRDLGGNPPDPSDRVRYPRADMAQSDVEPCPPPWVELGLTWHEWARQLREDREP
jgi:hypothetical protein